MIAVYPRVSLSFWFMQKCLFGFMCNMIFQHLIFVLSNMSTWERSATTTLLLLAKGKESSIVKWDARYWGLDCTWQRLICYGEAKALVFDSLGFIFVNLLLSISTMYFVPHKWLRKTLLFMTSWLTVMSKYLNFILMFWSWMPKHHSLPDRVNSIIKWSSFHQLDSFY